MNSVSVPLDGHGVQARSRRSIDWRRWAREPLLHFALLGALIFVVAHLVEESKARSESSIGLDANLDQRLGALYQTQFGVPPSEAQLRIIVDDYIDDEVLYREALRLGLDQDDEIIRRRASTSECRVVPRPHGCGRGTFTPGPRDVAPPRAQPPGMA